ncbi:hypothetical protein D3C86_1695220 [compost metagenome]
MKRRIVLNLPDTEPNVITAARRGVAFVEDFFESCLDRFDLHGAGTGQQHNKPVAPEASDNVVFAKTNAQHIGEGLEHVIAFDPPIEVVDVFELIKGEVQQRCRNFQLLTRVEPQLGQCDEAVAIGQQRQLVHARHLHAHQFLLGLTRQITQSFTRLLRREQQRRISTGFARFAWN